MSRRLERIIGIGGLLLAILTAAVLTWASVRHTFDLRWRLVIGPATAAGALVGLACRVFTAGVIGANIGAGCLLMFGGPLAGDRLRCLPADRKTRASEFSGRRGYPASASPGNVPLPGLPGPREPR